MIALDVLRVRSAQGSFRLLLQLIPSVWLCCPLYLDEEPAERLMHQMDEGRRRVGQPEGKHEELEVTVAQSSGCGFGESPSDLREVPRALQLVEEIVLAEGAEYQVGEEEARTGSCQRGDAAITADTSTASNRATTTAPTRHRRKSASSACTP